MTGKLPSRLTGNFKDDAHVPATPARLPKGANQATLTLADGNKKTYVYAWKGGPRIDPTETQEAAAQLPLARSVRSPSPRQTLNDVFDEFIVSPAFLDLRPRTKLDYRRLLKKIRARLGDTRLEQLTDRQTRGDFSQWRDELAQRSRRQADYAYSVLARAIAWALDRGIVEANPCENPGRLYRGTRAEKVWSAEEESTMLSVAPPHVSHAMHLALWTAQRQGDLLKLRWSDYDGKYLRLKQGKTGVRVQIPVASPLKRILDSLPRRAATVLTTLDGAPWTPDGFRASWGKAKLKAGIADRTFHDLRGTAVTRLSIAGATIPEIATLTGHSLRDVQTILDANYLNRDPTMAESAIRKLESVSPKGFPNAD